MTAKEMFEELGYKLREAEAIDFHCSYIIYEAGTEHQHKVMFATMLERYDVTTYGHASLNVCPKLHNAITQQMKELGWIK